MKTVIVANHYQNENCHPDGKIKVSIGADSAWRWERLDNANGFSSGRARSRCLSFMFGWRFRRIIAE